MRRPRLLSTICFAALGCIASMGTGHTAETKAAAGRGEYLAHIMDCTGCHTPGVISGKPDRFCYLGGSEIGFDIPGRALRAVRTGVRPDGR